MNMHVLRQPQILADKSVRDETLGTGILADYTYIISYFSSLNFQTCPHKLSSTAWPFSRDIDLVTFIFYYTTHY